MSHHFDTVQAAPGAGEFARVLDGKARPRGRRRVPFLVAAGAIALAAIGGGLAWARLSPPRSPPLPPPPQVTISPPLQRTVQASAPFLGQFSAVDSVELRAQVGGTLTGIDFRDGQIVHKAICSSSSILGPFRSDSVRPSPN